MIRAFNEQQKRIATAVVLKDKSLLQVYPKRQHFATEEEWKALYSGGTFQTEERQHVSFEEKEKKTGERWKKEHLSVPVETDTPMQKVVRQLYFQVGLADSIIQSRTAVKNRYRDVLRLDSGLYVMLQNGRTILPVYFNRKSGVVIFDGKNMSAEPIDGLIFFKKDYVSMEAVTPFLESAKPEQKVVIYHANLYKSNEHIESLTAAGYHVIFYHAKYGWLPSTMDKLTTHIPNVVGIITPSYSERVILNRPKKPEAFILFKDLISTLQS